MLALPQPWIGFHASPHRFLWHEPSRTAILADVHLGAYVSLANQGIFIPDTASTKIENAWAEVLKFNPARIVINGDLFDNPRGPDAPAVGEATRLFAQANCPITLLLGNHDPYLRGLFDPPVTVANATDVGGVAMFHGHQSTDARGIGDGEFLPHPDDDDRGTIWLPKGIVVGHQHPSVTLASATRRAKMHCFVLATLEVAGRKVSLLILPAFSPLPLGSDLRTRRNWILDLPRPEDAAMRILGLVEPQGAGNGPQVLDFGALAGLPG